MQYSLDISALNWSPAVRQHVTSCIYRAIWANPEKKPSNMYRYVQGANHKMMILTWDLNMEINMNLKLKFNMNGELWL